jgi:para-nitrobenzyl esterase
MRILARICRSVATTAIVAVATLGLAQSQPVVLTSDGTVAGVHRDGVSEFLGIPYAAPPIGNLRWQPPQPHAKWNGIWEATSFTGGCVQNQPGLFAHPSLTEDCLYLNVYTPDNFATTPKDQRGVLVWFPGGAMTAGESDDYDGSRLATVGDSVVVTVNFRVGYLGFFAGSQLDAEGHLNGNYGTMDTQMALQWVQHNIAKFGGDPHRVTIFGQSGGATAVMVNLISPLSKGLFQRIINESGTHITGTPLPVAEQRGAAIVAKAGCDKAADVMTCMRALTPLQILDLGLPPPSYFVIDGAIVTGDPFETFRTGKFNHVPIMTGLVEDEQSFFMPEIAGGPPVPATKPLTAQGYADYIRTYGDDNVAALTAAYPLSSFASPSLAEIALAQGNKACIARQFDRWWSQYVPVYAYQFDDETSPSYFPAVSYPTRAFHTSELEYIFPLFHGGQGRPHQLNAVQTKLANQLALYWGTFARNGNPNNAADPHWQPYSQRADDAIALIEPKPHMTFGYGAQTYHNSMHNSCDVWDPIPLTGGRS